jgi:hypothetical protein
MGGSEDSLDSRFMLRTLSFHAQLFRKVEGTYKSVIILAK